MPVNSADDEPLLRWFGYESDSGEVPIACCKLAELIVNKVPQCEERRVALRKILEALDAIERAECGV